MGAITGMGMDMRAYLLLTSCAFAMSAALPLGQLRAGESVDYCVHCVNPDTTYVCRVNAAASSAQGQQFLCIMNIAQQYGHDSCTAANQPDNCTGTLVVYDAIVPDARKTAAVPEREAPPASPPQEATPAGSGEPRTLVEFSKQTAQSTKSGLQSVGRKTGEAIENTGEQIDGIANKLGRNIKKATSTTVKCLTSLFAECSGNSE